jgi:hypothetical protein
MLDLLEEIVVLISAVFWDITRRRVVIVTDVSGQRIGPILKGQ